MADLSPRAKQAFDYFTGKGLTDFQAAGLVGNLMGESSLNPDSLAKNDAGPGLDSHGIAQWNRDRWSAMQEFAAQQGKASNDFGAQLDFVWHELNTSHTKNLAALQASTDVDSATDAGIMFEGPKGSDKGPRFGDNWSGRNAYARTLVGEAPNMSPVAPEPTRQATEPYNPIAFQGIRDGQQAEPSVLVPKPTPSWSDLAMATLNYWTSYAKQETFGDDAPDMNWINSRTEDTFKNTKGFNALPEDKQNWVIQNSMSEQSMSTQIARAQERTEDETTFNDSGWTGTAARLAVGLLDPEAITLELGTGPLGPTGAIGSRIMRMGLEAARQGAITATVQAPQLHTTPNYSVRDLAIDTGVGMAGGAVFGALTRKLAHVDPSLGDDVGSAFYQNAKDTVDAVHSDMARLNLPEGIAKAGLDGSVGAAKATPLPASETAEGITRAAAQVDNRTAFSASVDAFRIDEHKAIVASGDQDILATANSLIADPVGDGGIYDRGGEDAWNFKKRKVESISAEFDRQHNDAFEDYVKEQTGGQGVNMLNIYRRAPMYDQFSEEITQAVVASDRSTFSPAVQRGAQIASAKIARTLREAQTAGLEAAQGIEHRDNYMHMMPSRENLRAAVNAHGEEAVADVVAQAWENGNPDSARIYASKIARREGVREGRYAVKDARQGVQAQAREQFEHAAAQADETAAGELVGATREFKSNADHLDYLHKEHVDNAKAYAARLKAQATELRKQIQSPDAAKLAANLEGEAEAAVRGAKTAAKKARIEVNKGIRAKQKQLREEAKSAVPKAREKVATSKKKVQADHDAEKAGIRADRDLKKGLAKDDAHVFTEEQLDKAFMDAFTEESDRAFKEAQSFWFKRAGSKYIATLRSVTEKDEGAFMRGMSGEDREALKNFLTTTGHFSEDEAELIADQMKGSVEPGAAPLRHRAPLDADTKFVPRGSKQGINADPFNVRSLFEQNSEKITNRYVESMMGAAALAKAGFQSEAEALNHIAKITSPRKLEELGEIVTPSKAANMRKAKASMEYYVKRILGRPIEDPEAFVKTKLGAGIAHDFSFVQFMQQNGISQLGDIPKIFARTGTAAALAHFNIMGVFKALRGGMKGVEHDELMRAIECYTGVGTVGMRTRLAKTFDGLDNYLPEDAATQALRWMKHKSQWAAKATTLTSGTSPVNDWMLRWSARSTLQAFVDHATGVRAISQKLLNDTGLNADLVAALKQMVDGGHIELNPRGTVSKLNVERLNRLWGSEIDQIMGIVNREARTQILEVSPAHMPKWMNATMGQILGQFKSYMISSYASNTMRNIKLHDASAAQSLIATCAWGAMVYALQTEMRAQGKGDGKEEYLDKYLYSRKGIAAATLGRSADLTVLPFIVDSIMSPLSELSGHDLRVFDNTRTSGLGAGVLNGNAAYSMLGMLADATYGSLKDAMRSDQQVTKAEALRRSETLLPWLKTYGVLNAVQAGINHSPLPDKEPRDKTFD